MISIIWILSYLGMFILGASTMYLVLTPKRESYGTTDMKAPEEHRYDSGSGFVYYRPDKW